MPGYHLPNLFGGLRGSLYSGLYGAHVSQNSNGNQAAFYLFNCREFDGRCLNGRIGRFNDTGKSTGFNQA